jgi:putative peptide zinc metalloprotease protein
MNFLPPLLSPDWYRVAHMRPRLRTGVRVSRQTVRGETWYVLSDPISGRHHRFNDIAYGLIGSCDGSASIDEIWSVRVTAHGDDAPSQAEAIRVIAQAFAANLFVGDIAPDALAIVKAQQREQGRRRRANLNPLSLRVPLWDPDRFLSEHMRSVAWLFSFWARLCIGLVIALGALLLLINAGVVGDFARRELGSGRMLLTMWLAYPVLKALHEMAHAFAVKVHGGEVHEVGITLLMLTPVPYVDASASVAFADKGKRITVAAAGIVVEALLATVALCLWLVLEPGVLKDLAFAVVFVGALSTLVVNGNPLMRFDGYYVLCDAAELPNLALRSSRYWQYLAKRYGLGLGHVRYASRAPGERPWLIAYAPLAWSFRAAMLALLAVLVAQWHAGLGIGVLMLGLWALGLKPAWAALRWVTASPELRGFRPRAAMATLTAFALVGALAFGLPLPQRTHAPGVVWLPDDAMARLASDGFVEQFFVNDGQTVTVGTPIARLSNEPLKVELARVQAQLERQQVERAMQFELDARRAADADDELRRLAAERERLAQRVADLTVRAGVAGRVVIDTERVRLGQYLPQGEVIAQVLPAGAPMVRALVRNEDITLVRDHPGAISVQLAHAADARLATLDSAVPQASAKLPTRSLGEASGGSIALDTSDPSGRTAREPHFQLDLKLQGAADARVGARALVTFRHGEATAAELVERFLRQSFLRYFER